MEPVKCPQCGTELSRRSGDLAPRRWIILSARQDQEPGAGEHSPLQLRRLDKE